MADSVVLITGGGRGIGAATARLAAARGHAVVVNYRSQEDVAEALVGEITESGGTARAIRGDVSRESEVLALFEGVDRAFGRLDALVNNAGVVAPASRLQDMSAARMKEGFSVNLMGAFLCAREAVRRMATGSGGSGGVIVNVSSVASRLGSPFEYIDYAASKGALDTMTLGLSKEVAADGIRVVAVRPGLILTDIHASGGEPDRVERLRDRIPLARGGRPEEVARAIVWLLSDDASYTTGAILDVAGGR